MSTKFEYETKEASEALLAKKENLLLPKNEESCSKHTDNIKRNKSVVLLEHKKNDMDMVKWKLVPPDGGWGWLVLFGATMVNILVPGTIKSFGVLFVEFLEAFDATAAEGSWIPALCYFLYSSLGPVSSILSVRFSYRIVTILGGIFAAGGMVLSFWANSVYFLYVSYGVFVGIGAGLSFPPTVYIVCSYFLKLRGVANGICISGSAFGSIIIPPILRVLLVTYGYRGAVLIMGGLTFNVFVAALFYDKVEKHMKKEIIDSEKENRESKPKFSISNNDSLSSLQNIPQSNSFLEHIENSTVNFNRSASSVAMQNIKCQQRERKISMPQSRQDILKIKARESTNSNSILHPVSENMNGNTAMDLYSQSRLPSSRRKPAAPTRSTSTSSFQYVSTPYHGSTLTLQPEIFASSFSLRSNKSKIISEEDVKKPKLLDLSLLMDPIYLVILISNATNAISYTNFIILLPSYAKSLGFDKDQGAMLLSIVSALDLVGRIGGSALSDLTSFPKCYYFVAGLFLSGISLSLLPLFLNYWVIASFSAVFGLASGTYVGITAIVMADMLGNERLQSTYGMGLFVNGILQLIGPPLCGLWYTQVKSFVSLFIVLGIALTAGAGLWSFVPCIKKIKQSKKVNKFNANL